MTMIRLMAVKAGSSEALHPPTLTFPPTPAPAHSSSSTAAHSTQQHTAQQCRPVCNIQELGELVEHANAPRTRQFQDLASFDNLSVCLSTTSSQSHESLPKKIAPRNQVVYAKASSSLYPPTFKNVQFNRNEVFRKTLTFMHSSILEGDRNEYWWRTFWVDLGRAPLPLLGCVGRLGHGLPMMDI